MIELPAVFLGLFCHHSVVGFYLLHLVDKSVALEDVHILRFPVLIRQIVGGHLVVVRC